MASEQAKELAAKQSTVRIGDTVPNFTQNTTFGEINFHEALGDSWAILFSHPRFRTPICTTELAAFAKEYKRFEKMGVKVFAFSVDTQEDNDKWTGEIAAFAGVEKLPFPIDCDADYKVSLAYGMVNQDHVDAKGMPLTVRSVFFINPQKKCMAIISYPANVGRNSEEIFRVLEALQLTEKYTVACPVNWTPGKKVVVPPFVSTEDAQAKHGELEIVQPYLRFVNDPSQ